MYLDSKTNNHSFRNQTSFFLTMHDFGIGTILYLINKLLQDYNSYVHTPTQFAVTSIRLSSYAKETYYSKKPSYSFNRNS